MIPDDRVMLTLFEHTFHKTISKIGGMKKLSMNLSEYRKILKIDEAMHFIIKDLVIHREVEGDFTLADVVEKKGNTNQLHLKYAPQQLRKNNQGKSHDSGDNKDSDRKKLLKEHETDKTQLENLLKQLDQSQKIRQNDHDTAVEGQKKKLEQIKSKLKSITSDFDTNWKLDPKELEIILQNQIQRSEILITQLKAGQQFTPNEILQRHSRRAYNNYYGSTALVNSPVVDFRKSKINIYDNYKSQIYREIYEKGTTIWERITISKEEEMKKGTVDAKAFNPILLISAGVGYGFGSDNQRILEECLKQKSMNQIFYGVWLSEGYAIGIDEITFNDNFKQAYKNAFNVYLKLRSSSQEKEDLKQIENNLLQLLGRYGGELEIGCYVFDGKFLVRNKYSFSQTLTKEQKYEICNMEINAVVKGSGLVLPLFLSGKLQGNLNSSTGKINNEQKLTSKYSVTRESQSFTENYGD